MTKKTLFAGGLVPAALSLSIAAAFAHGGAEGVVKDRMDAMKEMGKAVKATSAMFKGEAPYDLATVRKAAETINAHSGAALVKMFPEGTDHAPSEALPKIWNDRDRFEDLANRLKVLSEGLAEAADNGPGEDGSGGHMMEPGSMMGSDGTMMEPGAMMGDGSMMDGSMMGGQSMMDGSMMDGSGMPTPEMLAAMPAEGVFNMVVQTCSSCHTEFRRDKE
ncbi:c-type cytochrome [Rhodobium gokarnense]|uniref:Cytochrome c556 n=1 Tax=Rhodobium gokarnense TaxID=364296 RepID=A0ABT3HG63_9HYPH|nr:cytochrome c [Rhodobium gokarnense]MCW2309390.1 cytochrome c556 [Rhodobium gokarnense]